MPVPPDRPHPLLRFGLFEVDLASGELCKQGRRIKLQEQPFRVLALLLERPGQVVTREELRSRLWQSDTFVDFDNGLNASINKLRDALGDSADSPHWIETLPRRGYRFIGRIEGKPPAASQKAEDAPKLRSSWLTIAAWTFAVSLFVLAALLVYRWPRSQPQVVPAILVPLPFTALPGIETSPAFSPDGSRITFAWNGDPESHGRGFDLYVKAIGSETMLRLTQHPSEWLSPVWSPDGTQIAFHRMAGADTGLYVVPAFGGPERKLRSTRIPYADAAPISWSPDGKWIAFGDPLPTELADRVFLLSLDTLETRPIPHNPRCRHEAVATFSHSGAELAYVCVRSTNELELHSIALPDGASKTVTSFSNYMAGFTWTADDSGLIFSQASGAGPELYQAALANGVLRRLSLPPNAAWPAVSSKGDKLTDSASSDNINIWRKDLLHPELPAVKLISSTQGQNHPQYSPDGKHVAFQSSRSGPWNPWMGDADGTNLVQIAKLEASPSNPRWSPDGQHIVFNSKPMGHNETYIVNISERVPRKLITSAQDTSTPSWSHDGKWIYFRSHEALGHKIYRCSASGGEKVLVSADPDAIGPLESSDGRAVYFAARELNALLKKVSLEQPDAEPLAEGLPRVSNWTLWTIAVGGIYFVPADAPRSLHYFDFTTKQIREVFKVDKDFDNGLSVSPDGRYVLYSQMDEQNSDIMIVDHFH